MRLGQILSVVALMATFGGHWVVLQSFAWVRMIVANSEHAPLVVAVEHTFDGKHPCEICKSIESGKGLEKKQQGAVTVSKLVLICEETRPLLHLLIENAGVEICDRQLETRKADPPVPPPRRAVV